MLIWISVMWKIDIKICEYLDNKTISQKWCPLYLIIFLEIKNKKGLFTLGPKLGGSERGYLVPQGLHCLKNWGIIDFYVPYSQQNCLTSLQIHGKIYWYLFHTSSRVHQFRSWLGQSLLDKCILGAKWEQQSSSTLKMFSLDRTLIYGDKFHEEWMREMLVNLIFTVPEEEGTTEAEFFLDININKWTQFSNTLVQTTI